jgi:ABC-type uncharacterized transport system substrate-binding protein
MKYILVALIGIGFTSCRKCATCSSYIVSAQGHEQLYSNTKLCGEDLTHAKQSNGKYTEYTAQDGTRQRATVVTTCDN